MRTKRGPGSLGRVGSSMHKTVVCRASPGGGTRTIYILPTTAYRSRATFPPTRCNSRGRGRGVGVSYRVRLVSYRQPSPCVSSGSMDINHPPAAISRSPSPPPFPVESASPVPGRTKASLSAHTYPIVFPFFPQFSAEARPGREGEVQLIGDSRTHAPTHANPPHSSRPAELRPATDKGPSPLELQEGGKKRPGVLPPNPGRRR